MKILIGSPTFRPSVGGLERVVEQLAEGLVACGDDVTVVTRTSSESPDRCSFRVARRPTPLQRVRLLQDSDVFLQANVALRDLWPLLLVRRPWVVSHHGIYGGLRWRDRVLASVKLAVSRRSDARIAVSRFLAARLGGDIHVIPNPFREDLFRRLPEVERDRDLVFVGRLVSDKGCATLIAAVARLAAESVRVNLTVVGDGPERDRIFARVADLGLERSIAFTGRLDGEDLVRVLNRHRVLVVPSRVEEGFGVVALEAIACGCVVVGSATGGIPEAIGPCGRTFPAGDEKALARILRELLGRDDLEPFRRHAEQHLEPSRPGRVVEHYRAVLRRAAGGGA